MKKNAVAFCVTESHIQLTAISLASIICNYSSQNDLDILIVVDELSHRDILRIKSIGKLYGDKNVTINIWHPPEIVKRIKNYKNKRFPEVTLWRLFLPMYFNSYENILYLDNDTIVYDDVTNFFNVVHQNKAIAAVRDFYFSVISDLEDNARYFGVKTMKNYFNSGVILFNVTEFNNLISADEILNMINKNNYLYLDQTILNIICEGNIEFLPYEYNYQKDDHWLYDWAKENNRLKFLEIEKSRKNVKIRHFVEFEKNSMPWEHLTVNDIWERDFWKYLEDLKQ